MSLQVWLPLNGNLNNQGLSNVTVTNNSATVSNDGKIGQCYSFSNAEIYGDYLDINNLNKISGCCWVYLTSLTSAQYFFHLGGQGSWGCKFSIDYEGSIRFQINGREYTTGINLSSNTWYHVCVTWNGIVAKLYLNGYERYSSQTSGTYSASNHYAIGARTASSTGNTFAYRILNGGKLNDVRIYDHCLSPKEVKEISKGLVLHYKLDDAYVEGTTNLLNYSNLEGHGSSWTLQNETFNGTPIYKNIVTSPNTGNNAGFRIKSTILSQELSSSTKITISFYKRLNTVYGKNLGCYIRVTKSDSTNQTIPWSYNKSNWANDPDSIGKWEFITSTVTIPSGCTSIINVYVFTDNATGGDCDFSQIQLELKDHATPYVNGTRNQTTVYDCSGYNNNGTITGSLSASSNTPRYEYCTMFPKSAASTSQRIQVPFKFNPNAWTISFWKRCDWTDDTVSNASTIRMFIGNTTTVDSTVILIYKYGTGRRMLSLLYYINSSNERKSITAYNMSEARTDDAWVHFCTTFDGTTLRAYCNGVLDASSSLPAGSTLYDLDGNLYINYTQESTTDNYMSDIRVYTTALSDQDILDLYNTSAYIDNGQNLHCYEFTEDDVTSPEIEKTGIVKTQEFNEFPDDIVLYDYIESTGTQYIDTNFNPNNNTRVVTEFMPISDDNAKGFFGAYPSNNFTTATYGLYYSSSSGSAFSNYQSDTAFNRNTYLLHDVKHKVDKNKNLLYIDNNLVLTHTAATFQSSISMHVFKLNFTSYPRYAKMKLYYFKIYDNDVLVRDYLPCTKNGEAGLWDRVNNQFYGNAGTGTFTLGNPIQTVTSLYQDKINTKQMIEL